MDQTKLVKPPGIADEKSAKSQDTHIFQVDKLWVS